MGGEKEVRKKSERGDPENQGKSQKANIYPLISMEAITDKRSLMISSMCVFCHHFDHISRVTFDIVASNQVV